MKNFDNLARECFKKSPNTIVAWLLMASYCYYCRYESIISDSVYDKMMKYFLDNYEKITHRHKHFFDKNMLEAGTAFNIKREDYPLITRVAAEKLMEDL
jgi:NAD-dependent DNA ligase